MSFLIEYVQCLQMSETGCWQMDNWELLLQDNPTQPNSNETKNQTKPTEKAVACLTVDMFQKDHCMNVV